MNRLVKTIIILGLTITAVWYGIKAVPAVRYSIRETENTTSAVTDDTGNTVTYVVDGDTLVCNIDGENKYIRLIGVDTPECVCGDTSRNCTFGESAAKYTKSLVKPGDTVYLEYDTGKTDKYGRTLAYVYLSSQKTDKNMLNYILVVNGYAVAKEYPPDTAFADVFEQAMTAAQHNKTGMWSDSISDADTGGVKGNYI